MPSELRIKLHSGPGQPEPNTYAVHANELVPIALDPPPPDSIIPTFRVVDNPNVVVTFDWEQRTLTASQPGSTRIICSWSGYDGNSNQGYAYSGLIFLTVLPEASTLGGRAVRNLVIYAPDENLYILTMNALTHFMSVAQARGEFSGFGFVPEFLNSGVIQANLPSFAPDDGSVFLIHLLHLPNMLSLLEKEQGEARPKLLLRVVAGDYYVIEPGRWPTVPLSGDDLPELPPGIGQGSHIIRARVVSKNKSHHYFLLDLQGLLELIQPGQKNLVVSKPENTDSGIKLQYYQVDSQSGLSLYNHVGKDPLVEPSFGKDNQFLATVVEEKDGSGQSSKTFFFHLKNFVDAVEAWNPGPDNKKNQDVLLRVPDEKFYDFTQDNLYEQPSAENSGHIAARLKTVFLAQGAAIGNITDLNGISKLFSLSSKQTLEPGTKVEPSADESIISCYLLDLQSLRGGS